MNVGWAKTLISGLQKAGVERFFVSPGSRSTPLVLALSDLQADATVVIDERAAGFAALGAAKSTGKPSVLICTSGSALAHYTPAVVEASYAYVPLIIVSADRPAWLQTCGAAQTIDQTKFYGNLVRRWFDMGTPAASLQAFQGVFRKAMQAVHESVSPIPGPVHVNVPFAKPLEPLIPPSEDDIRGEKLWRDTFADSSGIANNTLRVETSSFSEQAQTWLEGVWRRAKRPIVVVGPSKDSYPQWQSRLMQLCERHKMPALIDATTLRCSFSQAESLPVISSAVLESAAARAALSPDLIIEVENPPLSTAYQTWLGETQATRIGLRRYEVLDASGLATTTLVGEISLLLATLNRLPVVSRAPTGDGLAAICRAAIAKSLDEAAANDEARFAWEALRAADAAEATLVVGNSLPIRWVNLLAPGLSGHVITQRGASGIDGLVASAWGVQWAQAKPTVLLIGDVSLAHDIGSMTMLRQTRAPLVIVCLDNQGGRIFDRLPIRQHGIEDFSRYFTTSPQLDFAEIARSFGLPSYRLEHADDMAALVQEKLAQNQASVIVAGCEAESGAKFWRRFDQTITTMLAPRTSF